MPTRGTWSRTSPVCSSAWPSAGCWLDAARTHPARRSQGSDEEGSALAGHPGEHQGRLLVPAQGEALAQVVGYDGDTALLDGQPADAAFAQGGLERLLAERHLLD